MDIFEIFKKYDIHISNNHEEDFKHDFHIHYKHIIEIRKTIQLKKRLKQDIKKHELINDELQRQCTHLQILIAEKNKEIMNYQYKERVLNKGVHPQFIDFIVYNVLMKTDDNHSFDDVLERFIETHQQYKTSYFE